MDTVFRYGTITGKYVIYRGQTTEPEDMAENRGGNVTYLNVEEYLRGLRQ